MSERTTAKKQTKSKERIRDHGEVFTAEREVKAMCDLVKDETERIDSRFLEPKKRRTCGKQYLRRGYFARQCDRLPRANVRDMG